ncbi:MAG TPA: glycoside hydrolase family 88 protein [Ramlibacter sp.]|uniref:glycoside hydrolase family 88 protein n=1 Tax=Ramlibacter sp. TaxID=1917967 RepID=UPI002C4B6046|nr:glycoside hydrolase family 88 protein [Ramlibacter sp.]HVZ43530.1 glycoside hydrolase family 88 protein [Ramlibacter sp.]
MPQASSQPGQDNSNERVAGLRDFVERVARYSQQVNFRRYENWENGILADGLRATGQAACEAAAAKVYEHALQTQDSAGQLAFNLIVPGEAGNSVDRWSGKKTITGATHSAVLGPGVLHLYRRLGNASHLDAARRQAEYLRQLPRTRNGGIAHREEGRELWVDSMWFVIPFLAEFGAMSGEAWALEDSALQIRAHAQKLRDAEIGLFRHIWCETPNFYPQSTFWSRGNGWVIASFVDAYPFFADKDPIRGELAALVRGMADALLPLQDASGFWRNTLDDRLTPMESSGTMMFAYALKKALDLGMLDGSAYRDAAFRAMRAACLAVNDEGGVEYVTLPPGGPGAKLGVAPYGQGWFLLAASRFASAE